jgi:hypothetical protein
MINKKGVFTMAKMRKQNRDKFLARFLDKSIRDMLKYVFIQEGTNKNYAVYTNTHLLGIVPSDWIPDVTQFRDIRKTPYKFPNYEQVLPNYKETTQNTSKVKFEYVDVVRKDKDNKQNIICFMFDDGLLRAYNAEYIYHIMQMTQKEEITLEAQKNNPNSITEFVGAGAHFIIAPLNINRVDECYKSYYETWSVKTA